MKEKVKNKRRIFLKKLAYSAPVLTILGQLVKPTQLNAINSVPGPPGDDFPSGFE